MEELQDAQDYPASITATFSLRCSPGLQSDTDNATGWLDPDDPLVSAGVGWVCAGEGPTITSGHQGSVCALCWACSVLRGTQTTQRSHLSGLVPSGNIPDCSMIGRVPQEWLTDANGVSLTLIGEDTEAVESRKDREGSLRRPAEACLVSDSLNELF